MSVQSLGRGSRCLNSTLRSLPLRRTFAKSAILKKYGAVPEFKPTSNPELDAHLQTIRNKIFLPTHLSVSQRDLIYLDKNQRELSIEPVYATIKGERFQLEHIDRTKDIPSTADSLFGSVTLMRKPKDWDNVPNLLRGLKNAGRLFENQRGFLFPRLTRQACIAGRSDIIIECARRVDDTAYKLADKFCVIPLMFSIQNDALKGGWAAKETKRALNLAESVIRLQEDNRHGGGRISSARIPVIGTLLQLSAIWATRFHNGVDIDGRVKLYTDAYLAQANMLTSKEYQLKEDDPHSLNASLSHLCPHLQGLKLAVPILGESEELTARISALETYVERARILLLTGEFEKQKQGENEWRGMTVYNSLLGPDAVKVRPVGRLGDTQSNETTTEA